MAPANRSNVAAQHWVVSSKHTSRGSAAPIGFIQCFMFHLPPRSLPSAKIPSSSQIILHAGHRRSDPPTAVYLRARDRFHVLATGRYRKTDQARQRDAYF
jgi:hypothetical protein